MCSPLFLTKKKRKEKEKALHTTGWERLEWTSSLKQNLLRSLRTDVWLPSRIHLDKIEGPVKIGKKKEKEKKKKKILSAISPSYERRVLGRQSPAVPTRCWHSEAVSELGSERSLLSASPSPTVPGGMFPKAGFISGERLVKAQWERDGTAAANRKGLKEADDWARANQIPSLLLHLVNHRCWGADKGCASISGRCLW